MTAAVAEAPASGETTEDLLLGGRVRLRQPRAGALRATLDPVLLAAAVPALARPSVAAGIAGACLIDMDKPGRHFLGRSPFPAALPNSQEHQPTHFY